MTVHEFETALAEAVRSGRVAHCAAGAWRASFRNNPRRCTTNLARVAPPQPVTAPRVDWDKVGAAVARANTILGTPGGRPYPAQLFPELARTRPGGRRRAAGSVEGTGGVTPPRAAASVSSTEPDPTQVAVWTTALFPDTLRARSASRVTTAAD